MTAPRAGGAKGMPLKLSREHTKGVVFIFVVACLWVFASFLTQSLEDDGMPSVLLTYISNSLFVLYLPLNMVSAASYVEAPARVGAAVQQEPRR